MSKSRDIADSAATINFIDNVTSDVQSQLNTLTTAIDNVSVTSGTLTKTFSPNESSTINLTSSVLAPVVSVTKEVPQSGVTNNNWDVNSTTENYTRLDSATATTLSFTGGGSPFVLGTGSFASADVGKTIEANDGAFVLTAADGSYVETTAPTSYDQVASGDWSMYGVVYNAADEDLQLSNTALNVFDLSTAVYSQSFSITSEDASPTGIAFNTDGTKMFVSGNVGDNINEYVLSTGFDVSTASFVDSFSVASQGTGPTGLSFNTDGTKMFVCGSSSDSVHEYILSTGFDVSTASFSSSFSVATQTTAPQSVVFNTDGTKMFVLGNVSDNVNEYTLSTGFNLSTASFSQFFSVNAQETSPRGLTFNADGTKMFVSGNSGDDINEYTLSNGFDISTASFVDTFDVSAQDGTPEGLVFNSNGTKLFVVGGAFDQVYEYSVGSQAFPTGYQPVHTTASIDSTYWTDINSMTADQAAGDGNVYYAISTDDRTTWTVIDNTDGERDIVRNNAGTWQYNSNGTYASETWVNGATNTELATLAEAMEGAETTTGYSLNGASYSSLSFSIGSQETNPRGMTLNSTGTKMYVVGPGSDTVYQYSLSTAWDVSTSSYDSVSFSVASQETSPWGLTFNSDGTKMYILGTVSKQVFQYTLSTAFDLSTASYSGISFNPTSQAGNPLYLTFNTDGTIMYIGDYIANVIYQYALATAFNVNTAGYSSISYAPSGETSQTFGLEIDPTGTKAFILSSLDVVHQYSLSTAFDISTATYDSLSLDLSPQDTSNYSIHIGDNGSKLYSIGNANDSVYQYSIFSIDYTNQMDKTQLDAVTDPNHIALGDDLDLSIIFNMTSGTTVPSSDGVAINYDANVLNKGAVLGTDYDFDAPAGNAVRVTALTAGNFKVRVV